MNKTVPGKSPGISELTWTNAPDILTVEEAASLARIPRNAAYEAVRQGVIPSVNLGMRRIRISKVVLAKVLAINVEQEPQPSVRPESR